MTDIPEVVISSDPREIKKTMDEQKQLKDGLNILNG